MQLRIFVIKIYEITQKNVILETSASCDSSYSSITGVFVAISSKSVRC